jgi:lysophospholipase L1-like esterase
MRQVLHRLGGVVVGMVLLGAMGVIQASPASAQPAGGVRVMPLGDSITDGFNIPGGYRIDLWQQLVAAGHTVDFVGSASNGPASLGDRNHEGHSGWRIDQLSTNINAWMQQYQPRTILLHIGTNDMIGNSNGAPQRLSTLIDQIVAASPDVELFVATLVPLSFSDANVRAFNAALPAIVDAKAAAGHHVHLVDMYSKLTTADLADGVHPNASGYSKMADAWFEALLAEPSSLTPVGTPVVPALTR